MNKTTSRQPCRKITFDQLLARREQREANKTKVGMLAIPGTEVGLEARMPMENEVMQLYGEYLTAADAAAILDCSAHAIYACCPQLQDRALQVELGVEETPMEVVTALFDVAQRDALGGEAFRFMGFLRSTEDSEDVPSAEEQVKNALPATPC